MSNAAEVGPHDIELRDSFVCLGSPFVIGAKVGGSVSHNAFTRRAGYTPRLFRRSRLKQFAPLARRVHAVRTYWRWLA